jgi:hypothetical protein
MIDFRPTASVLSGTDIGWPVEAAAPIEASQYCRVPESRLWLRTVAGG